MVTIVTMVTMVTMVTLVTIVELVKSLPHGNHKLPTLLIIPIYSTDFSNFQPYEPALESHEAFSVSF